MWRAGSLKPSQHSLAAAAAHVVVAPARAHAGHVACERGAGAAAQHTGPPRRVPRCGSCTCRPHAPVPSHVSHSRPLGSEACSSRSLLPSHSAAVQAAADSSWPAMRMPPPLSPRPAAAAGNAAVGTRAAALRRLAGSCTQEGRGPGSGHGGGGLAWRPPRPGAMGRRAQPVSPAPGAPCKRKPWAPQAHSRPRRGRAAHLREAQPAWRGCGQTCPAAQAGGLAGAADVKSGLHEAVVWRRGCGRGGAARQESWQRGREGLGAGGRRKGGTW